MTLEQWIKELLPLLTAGFSMAAMLIGYLNNRKIDLTNTKVEEVHVSTNSKMDKMLAAVSAAEHAKGVLLGREQVKSEEGAAALTILKTTGAAPTAVVG